MRDEGAPAIEAPAPTPTRAPVAAKDAAKVLPRSLRMLPGCGRAAARPRRRNRRSRCGGPGASPRGGAQASVVLAHGRAACADGRRVAVACAGAGRQTRAAMERSNRPMRPRSPRPELDLLHRAQRLHRARSRSRARRDRRAHGRLSARRVRAGARRARDRCAPQARPPCRVERARVFLDRYPDRRTASGSVAGCNDLPLTVSGLASGRSSAGRPRARRGR